MDYTIQKFITPPLLIVKAFTSNNESDTSQVFQNIDASLREFAGEDFVYLIFELRDLPDSSIEVIKNCVNTLLTYQKKWQKEKKVQAWIVISTTLLSSVKANIPSEKESLTVIDDYILAIDAIEKLFADKDEYNNFGSIV